MPADPLHVLPQTGPARLVVEVLERGEAGARCRARVPPASPFLRRTEHGAVVPALLCLEMAAQASALTEAGGGVPRADGSSSHGWIVGVRDLRLRADELSAELDFEVRTASAGEAPPLRSFRFEVHAEGRLVAEGVLSTFRGP